MGEVNNLLKLANDKLVKMLSFAVLSSKGTKRKNALQKKGARKRRECAQFKRNKRENKDNRA